MVCQCFSGDEEVRGADALSTGKGGGQRANCSDNVLDICQCGVLEKAL